MDRQPAIHRDAVRRKAGPDHHVDRLVAAIERPCNFPRPRRPLYDAHHLSGEIAGVRQRRSAFQILRDRD